MKNKNVPVIFKILPMTVFVAGGFLSNASAASRIDGSIDISTYANNGVWSYAAANCDSFKCNQLQGFTVTDDALVLYNMPSGNDSYGKGTLRGFTGANYSSEKSGSPFIREYFHGNDMTYKPSTKEVFVSNGSKKIYVLNDSSLAEKTSKPLVVDPGIVSLGYDEVDDRFILTQTNGSGGYNFWFNTFSNNKFTRIDGTSIAEVFGTHGTLNTGQGMEYYKGYIYQTEDNWDSELEGEVGYINVYKAKLKSDGKTPDKGFGTKVATYYINAKDLGEIESISFRNDKAYLGFADVTNNVARFTSFNANVIGQSFGQPTYKFVDNADYTSVVITSNDTQLAANDGWTLSSDGYSLTKTVKRATLGGKTVAVYDRYGNRADVTYESHTNNKFGKTYTLTFDLNGGSGSMTTKTCRTSTSSGKCDIIIPSTEPTRAGYSFVGYSDKKSDASAKYFAGGSITISGNKTIYAIWSESEPAPSPEPGDTGEVSWIQEQTHIMGESKNLVFRIDYPKNKFVSLSIDGAVVPTIYYGVSSGSTIVTIDYDYIDTLDAGTHNVVASFEGVTVNTTFTTEEPVVPDDPATPDESSSEDVLPPDTGAMIGIGGGANGAYLIGASVLLVVSVITGEIVRRAKVNKKIQFK